MLCKNKTCHLLLKKYYSIIMIINFVKLIKAGNHLMQLYLLLFSLEVYVRLTRLTPVSDEGMVAGRCIGLVDAVCRVVT
jgi:hypothetical protein